MKSARHMLLVGAAVLVGCATVPSDAVDGKANAPSEIKTVTSMSEAEKQQGAKAHPELLAEFGGLYNGPQASYTASVGRKIAVQSSLSSQQNDFTVSLLNSPVNNAFAIPGGYVYVTRQLMALMNDEAELAGVLGHEVGHVAAQHGKRRQNAATRNSILGVLGQVVVGAVAGNSGIGELLQRGIGTGAQLLTLKYSRGQEYEADDLGIRYLGKAGYDPTALSTMLASLAAQNSLDARVRGSASSVPEWASTHPDPASRVSRAAANARATGVSSSYRNADAFLAQVNGILYGEDPKQGVIEGGRFLHPVLKLKFSAPQGFAMQNGTDAVTISGNSGQAQFTTASYSGSLDSHVQSIFQKLAGQSQVAMPQLSRTTINGLPAVYGTTRAATQNRQQVDVSVVAYEFGPSSAYHFIILTPAGQGFGPFSQMVGSVARMTDGEAAAIRPRKVQVVTVRSGDTVQSLAGRMAYADYQLDRFMVLNRLASNSVLRAGQKVKIITY